MSARQIPAPPADFVWIARMRAPLGRIEGSEGLHGGHGWTRFRAWNFVPLVRAANSPDPDRAAAARPAPAATWVPASLLPAGGVVWEQIGFGTEWNGKPITLALGQDGRVVQVETQRRREQSLGRTYRHQPFGGTFSAETRFGGYTIPSAFKVGNMWGTEAYRPFMRATLTSARYL